MKNEGLTLISPFNYVPLFNVKEKGRGIISNNME